MRVIWWQNKLPGVRLPMCVLAALSWVHNADAVAAPIFAGCRYAESRVMHVTLRELGLSIEELSAARIGHEARETLACDFEREGGVLDLSLGDPEEAARANLDMEQIWGVTLAVGERALSEERTQGQWTSPPVSGSLQGAKE